MDAHVDARRAQATDVLLLQDHRLNATGQVRERRVDRSANDVRRLEMREILEYRDVVDIAERIVLGDFPVVGADRKTEPRFPEDARIDLLRGLGLQRRIAAE